MKSLLRRKGTITEPNYNNIIEILDLKIDRERYQISLDGDDLTLPRKEFEILYLLASAPGKVFNREAIFEKIWGEGVIVGGRTIDVHIRKLREKLGRNYIETVKGVGYKFNSNV